MEVVLAQFPLLGRDILRLLDDRSLIMSREVNEALKTFVQKQNLPWIRMIQKHIGTNNEFLEDWNKIVVKTPTEMVKNLAIAVDQFYNFYQFYTFCQIYKSGAALERVPRVPGTRGFENQWVWHPWILRGSIL